MNKSTQYEYYVKEIYEQILEENGVKNIKVLHNVKLKGISGVTHQIDVYWEYEEFDEFIKVAIECKRYSKNVSLGIVRDFKSVLEDLKCSKGVIVTTKGFQKGAIEFANKNGIGLKVIRPAKMEELRAPKFLSMNVILTPRKVSEVKINLDSDWCAKNVLAGKPSFTDHFQKQNTDVVLVDENGKKIADLLDLENQLPVEKYPSKDNIHTFRFQNAFMIHTEQQLLKVSEVVFKYDVSMISKDSKINLHDQVKAIIKDCIKDKDRFLRK